MPEPQTAKQINTPVVGESEFRPNPPPSARSPAPSVTKSWRLGATGRMEGSREKVKALLAVETSVPELERDYLLRKIDTRPLAHNWIILFAHCSENHGKSVLDLDVESSTENI